MKREATEKRREQIKKAVLKIIAKEGLHNLSIRNLAKQVGITEGAIFRHFKSKRAIIISIMDDVKAELMSELRTIAKSSLPAEERLFKYLNCHIEYIVKNKGISILLFSEAAHFNYKVVRTRLRAILSEQESLITGIIKDGIDEKNFKRLNNIKDIIILYMSIPIALNVEMIFDKQDVTVENFSERMFNLIVEILKR
ncbi:MAG: TetR/AcrR family transcriptional regulator [Ignavibacteriaceae bacterium]|jgi:AcrR family transcriptional regulator